MLILKTPDTVAPNSILLQIRGGLSSRIDADLLEYLSQWSWFPLKSAASIYVCTRRIIAGKTFTIRMHRLITHCPDWMKVHHINHDTFDNRRDNLQIITEREHRHFDGWHIFKHQA